MDLCVFQWICVYLRGLARIYMDLSGFRLISWISGVRGFSLLADLCRPLASFGGLWHRLSSPLMKIYGALEAWILDAWRLGGLEAWRLVALTEAGGLEARGFEAGSGVLTRSTL